MSQVPAATPSSEATPAITPATTPPTTPPGEDKEVTMKESEVVQLKKDAARAASSQSELERLKRTAGRAPKSLPPEPFTDQDKAELHREISTRILSDERLQKAVAQDPLLKRALTGQNPLALLGQSEFVDVRDAVDQLFAFVEDEVLSRNGGATPPPTAPPAAPPASPSAPPAINGAPANPPVKTEEERRQEDLSKLSGMDKATASILSRVKVKQ